MKIFNIALLTLLTILIVPDQSQGADKKPIRIAYLQSDIHHLPCWVALEKGFYTREGLEVEVAGVFKAGPELMSAFAAGALDAGYVGEAPATTAAANRAARVVVLAQVNTEGSALVVKKDGPLQRFPDLSGKIVAIPGHATVQDFLLKKALKLHKLEPGAVRTIVIKPPEMIGALRTGQVDAFIAWEPHPAKAQTMETGRVLARSRDIWKDHPCCVLAVDGKFLAARPEEARRLVRAHVKATEFIHQNREEALKIGVKYTGMDEKTVNLAMQNVHYTYQLSVEGEREYVDFLSQMKYIKVESPQAFIREFLNLEILPEILKK
ncbi:MAG: ABC transporter substrate-binding protein [Desulfobacterota bacterium]|nr:ABC transporter substrate-binding protein [Thermodesulfobacteriota bacterium]